MPMKTLVVEDEFTSRILMQNFLARYGECTLPLMGKKPRSISHGPRRRRALRSDLHGYQDAENEWRGSSESDSQLETKDGVLSTNGVKILMVTSVDDPKEVVGSFTRSAMLTRQACQ